MVGNWWVCRVAWGYTMPRGTCGQISQVLRVGKRPGDSGAFQLRSRAGEGSYSEMEGRGGGGRGG
jgi:hypothetical protein